VGKSVSERRAILAATSAALKTSERDTTEKFVAPLDRARAEAISVMRSLGPPPAEDAPPARAGRRGAGRRRGHREGSIYRRRDGRWEARLTSEMADGRRRRVCFYGTTRKAVAERLTKALHDRDHGLPADPSQMTVKAYLARWLEGSVRHSVRPGTFVSYGNKVRLYVIPEIGAVRLQRLTPADVQALYSRLLGRGLSPRSVQYVHAILHRALKQALRWGLVARNVCEAVDRPQVQRREMRALTAGEAARFLEAARADRLGALYVLAVTSGLRQGELFGLHWQDVDLDAARVHVTRQLVSGEDGLPVLTDVKSRAGRRVVEIPALTVAALREHRGRQAEERLRLGDAWEHPELVFTTTIGTFLSPTNLTRQSFRPLLKRAGLPLIRFHDLRHTAASLLLAAGVHPKVVQERLGHSSIAITLDTYSHVVPSMQRAAADRLDALLAG
jgi:integrase